MLSFKNYNIADWFSFYRVAASPFLLLLVLLGEREVFSWLLLISYCTDMIDGFLARRLKITSSRGSQLDSLGDQVTLGVAFIGLFVFEYEFISENLKIILIPFGLYFVQMFLAFRKYGKTTAFHTYLAKLSAIAQGVFILWFLFFSPVYWLFCLMIILGIIETLEEIILIFMYPHWVAGVKGLYWAYRDRRRIRADSKNDTAS